MTNNVHTVNYDRIPNLPEEWYAWLTSEEEKTCQTYQVKPELLIKDYRQEIATTHDYEGRELLELLQNAADQAKEANIDGQVVIELLPEGMIVANKGTPFSIGGVLSLENSHLSPKWHNRRRTIGSKGLGFRAILNWSNSPIILSGALNLLFNKAHPENILSKLMDSNPKLKILVEKEQSNPENHIIPLLPFPSFTADGSLESLISDKKELLFLESCKSWRDKGFDTVIGIPFQQQETFIAARKQMESLRPEILLFVKHLKKIRFSIFGSPEKIWTKEGDNLAIITENNDPLGMWQIHRKVGLLPEDLLDHDQRAPLEYEIIVAVPDIQNLNELKTSPLFSHFPTEIDIPLPVVCHTTLELDQNRKHAQQRKSNSYVLDQSAEFLAQIAEKKAKEYSSGPNAGFRLLMPLKNYPTDLTREGFDQKLIEAAKKRAIVPTLAGKAVLATEAKLITGADNSWLPIETFPKIVIINSEKEEIFFNNLEIPKMSNQELKKRLLGIENLAIKKRATLICGIIKHSLDKSIHTSALLVDKEGKPIQQNTKVFTTPTIDLQVKQLDWIDLCFLNDELRLELANQLEAKDNRDLQLKLSTFGLVRYSLGNLILKLISSAKKAKEDSPQRAEQISQSLIDSIFSLYKAEYKSGKRPIFPEDATLLLPNQAGEEISAKKLYLSKGYGRNGLLLQDLYSKWAPEKLVATPKKIGLAGNIADIQDFLLWVGVAKWPRETFKTASYDVFLDFVCSKIPFPAKFDDYFFNSADEIKGAWLSDIRTIDGLDQILQNTDYTTIIIWLILDDRIYQLSKKGPTNVKLKFIKGYDRNTRCYRKDLPSYIKWKIENTEWIPGKNSIKLKPKECVIGVRAIEAIFPHPPKPSKKILEKYGLSDFDLAEGWRRSGVLTSLAELEIDDIYSRLLEMPEREPHGKAAKSLYRWLLEVYDNALGNGSTMREKFIKEGKMWGKYGEQTAYYPVSELRHANHEGLPTNLLNQLKIVDLPTRVRADKVKQIFGVETIDPMSIKQEVKDFQLVPGFDDRFNESKPYFFKLRESQTSNVQYLKRLKALSLKTCFSLTALMSYEGKTFEFSLPTWGWLIEKDTLYICIDPTMPLETPIDLLADSVGEAIASIFRIAYGGEFSRIFSCEKKNRSLLLRRMIGEDAEIDMDKIIEEFGSSDPPPRVHDVPFSEPIEEPLTPEKTTDDTNPPEQDVDDGNDNVPPAKPSGPLSIEPVEHEPTDPPTRRKLQIQKKSGGTTKTIPGHLVTNGAFCEKKAMEFEERDNPPRYPLLVSQIKGISGYGCDILSFNNPQDREEFKSGKNRDLKKISRFIEVKGRKNQSIAIELKGNELNSAAQYGKRFYLYRLYKPGADEYYLSILQDPCNQKEALEPSVYVDLNRAHTTEKFILIDGLQEEAS